VFCARVVPDMDSTITSTLPTLDNSFAQCRQACRCFSARNSRRSYSCVVISEILLSVRFDISNDFNLDSN
jgi:hypothetical protein